MSSVFSDGLFFCFIRRFALSVMSPLFLSWVLPQQNQGEDDSSSYMAREVAKLRDGQRKLALQMMQTSMRLTAYNEDELSEAFDNATATDFWLPTLQPDQSQTWSCLIEEGDNETYWDSYRVPDQTHERKPK